MYEYLQRICLFIILAEMLIHLRPAKQYERYLKMVSGFISLAIVLLPACELMASLGNKGQIISLEEFEQKMYEAIREGEESMQREMELQPISLDEEESLDLAGKEALCDKIDKVVRQKGYETKELHIEDDVLQIILKQKTYGEVGKIMVELSKDVETNLSKEIAKELNTDESNITVSVE